MTNIFGCPLVLVEWIDSRGANERWNHIEHFSERNNCVTCLSVGYKVHETDSLIVVAPHAGDIADEENLQFCGDMTIPKVCIKNITEIVIK